MDSTCCTLLPSQQIFVFKLLMEKAAHQRVSADFPVVSFFLQSTLLDIVMFISREGQPVVAFLMIDTFGFCEGVSGCICSFCME